MTVELYLNKFVGAAEYADDMQASDMLGRSVWGWFDDPGDWYSGVVVQRVPESERYVVQYEDGETETVSLEPDKDTIVVDSMKPVRPPWSTLRKRPRMGTRQRVVV
jgi:hypothetical protein